MKTQIISIALGLVALTLASPNAGSAPQSEGDNPKERPYQGTMIVSLTARAFPCFEFAAAGRLSHLGNSTVTLSHCFVSPLCVEGSATIIAANGDELYTTYEQCIVGGDGSFSYVEGTYTITGGTGRFEGASGSGTQKSVFNNVTGSGVATVDGTIVY
jgi:hypothetical protein